MTRSETYKAGSRNPGVMQGLVLISLAWVSTVAAVVIGPVLPTIAQTFKDVPWVDVKIPLVASGPSLLVAILAIPYGVWADKIGRRTLLLATLFLYGFAGMAPLLLSSLDTIVVSRLIVGLAESGIMTCGTALISDYYYGPRRSFWLAVQAATAPLTAVILAFTGGMLGAFGWRTPFYVYSWGFILIPLVLLFIWEPRRGRMAVEEDVVEDEAARNFSWVRPLQIAAIIVLSMIAFMVTVVQFSFLVTERGMTSPQEIGLWSAFVTIANPLGALLFMIVKARTAPNLTVAYTLFAAGFAIMSLIPTVPAVIVGGTIANLGAGILLPTAITWILSTIPAPLRGQGSGLWTTANFLGQFSGPLTIVALTKLTGSLSHAILVIGAACAVAAIIAASSTVRGFQKRRALAVREA